MKVLIADGDQKTVENITTAFKVRWPRVKIVQAPNIRRVEAEIEKGTPDIVIVNSTIVGSSNSLERIRQNSNVPIIYLTDRKNDDADLVTTLEHGADEYLVKPVGQMELLARANALIRGRKRTVV